MSSPEEFVLATELRIADKINTDMKAAGVGVVALPASVLQGLLDCVHQQREILEAAFKEQYEEQRELHDEALTKLAEAIKVH